MNEQLREEMLKMAVDGKLSCSVARKLAEQLGMPYCDIGAAANELGIRIKNCELGCF